MKSNALLGLVLGITSVIATLGDHPRFDRGPAKWRNIQQTSDKEIRGFLEKNQHRGRNRRGKNKREDDPLGFFGFGTGDYNYEEHYEENDFE